MKIAISCHPTQGGSGVVATELARALAGRGHEVHLVSDTRPFRLDADDRAVRFHRVNMTEYPLFKYPPQGLSLANKLAEVVVDHNIDIIHAHYAVPHAISAIIARQIIQPHPVKVVTTLHGTDITLVGSHRDFYRICRYAMLHAHGLTTVSEWLADRTMAEFDLERRPSVIPNFVDCQRFSPAGRAAYPADGRFQILHASNFRPVKRVFDVVRVFHHIHAKLPHARLVLVGEGPEQGLARELAGELGICGAVDFLGAQVGIEDIYRSSHLFLLLSEYESFGLSALEAMACGTPVIASRAGGLTEVVEEGLTGHLRPVGDVAAFAEAAMSALSDRSRWEAMSRAAPERAMAQFCTEKIIPQYEAFYERVLAG